MSLVFSAFVPHPPVIVPQIGKENLVRLEKTKKAMEFLEQELYSAKPEIIIVISPHGDLRPDAFTVNLCNEFEIDFEFFGDFSTKNKIKGDTILMSTSLEAIKGKFPINIISESKLDHGVTIPLYCLTQHLADVKIIPLYFSLFDSRTHLEFGKSLKEIIMHSDKRVAVIASGDLSHCLTNNAPVAYNAAGKEFDNVLVESIEKNDTQSIVNMDPELIEKAHECGYRSLLILLGIMNNINFKSKILSYESPFGVGYLVANFELN